MNVFKMIVHYFTQKIYKAKTCGKIGKECRIKAMNSFWAERLVSLSFNTVWQDFAVSHPAWQGVLYTLFLMAWGWGLLQVLVNLSRPDYMETQMKRWAKAAFLPFCLGCAAVVWGDIESIVVTLIYGSMFFTNFILKEGPKVA
ncbi:hypothetical protein [Hydrogenimonas sp.]